VIHPRFLPALLILLFLPCAAFGQEQPPAPVEGSAGQPAASSPASPATVPPPPSMPTHEMEDMNVAVLRTIDKLSARTTTFEIPLEKTVKFGSSLFIRVKACRKSSPLDQPENAAFLQIWEHKEKKEAFTKGAVATEEEKPAWVFSGWMFSSSPGVSAMDHPVYDVWVIDCKNAGVASKAQPFSTEAVPAASEMRAVKEKDTAPAPVEEKKAEEKPAVPAEKKEEEKKEDKPSGPPEKPDVNLQQPSFEDEGAAPNKGD
jgi:hypothetical protein